MVSSIRNIRSGSDSGVKGEFMVGTQGGTVEVENREPEPSLAVRFSRILLEWQYDSLFLSVMGFCAFLCVQGQVKLL